MTPFPDLGLTPIGLGCVTFGREIDEAASHALLDHAVAHGVTHLDTAAAYSQGISESIIGRWLATRRPPPGSISIATKILPPYEPGRIAESVSASLARLGVAAVDVLYLHRWDETAAAPEALRALDDLVRSGQVRALGVSNFNHDRLCSALEFQKAHGLAPFRVLQNNHNLAVSDIPPELVSLCRESGVSIVTYSPLGAGFLTGKHRQGVQAGSRFDIVPGHQDVYFHDASYRRLARLEEVAARTGHSQAHLAMAWALHQPQVTTVLVGGRTPGHLDQALAARDFNLPGLFAELEAA